MCRAVAAFFAVALGLAAGCAALLGVDDVQYTADASQAAADAEAGTEASSDAVPDPVDAMGELTGDAGAAGDAPVFTCRVSPDCPFFPGLRCLDGGCVACLQTGSGCTFPELCCNNQGCHTDGDGVSICY